MSDPIMTPAQLNQAINNILSSDAPAILTRPFAAGYRARRATRLFGGGRPDRGGWAAKITGPDKKFGFAREFIPGCFPLRYDRRAEKYLDFDGVQVQDVIQLRCADNSSGREVDLYIRITRIDDSGFDYVELSDRELDQLAHF